jgi:Mg2+ and Co2+ transporter CorA
MKIDYYKIGKKSLTAVKKTLPPEQWEGNIDWVDIRSDNLKEVADYFEKNKLLKDNLDFIEHPEFHSQPKIIDGKKVFSVVFSDQNNIYQSDYITVILAEKVLITVSPMLCDLLNYKNIILEENTKHITFLYSFFYRLIADLLSNGRINSILARNRINQAELELDKSPEKTDPNEIMKLRREANQLADIIDDQYVLFGILSSLSVNIQYMDHQDEIKELIKGFIPLNVTMARLEEKAESLHMQFILIQQQKSSKKINVLTITQAVFVPLTFIAGIYGMNFINMPELKFVYGYLYVWILFLLISGTLLFYFYKNGWFK